MRICLALLFAVAVANPVAARQKFVSGLFTATENGAPIELIAWAESTGTGQLRMANNSFLDDAPILPRTYRFLVNPVPMTSSAYSRPPAMSSGTRSIASSGAI